MDPESSRTRESLSSVISLPFLFKKRSIFILSYTRQFFLFSVGGEGEHPTTKGEHPVTKGKNFGVQFWSLAIHFPPTKTVLVLVH